MSLTITTDDDLLLASILTRNEFRRLTDKGKWPGGILAMHTKAKDKVIAWLRDRPEETEEDDLTNPTQFKDAQLQYVVYLLYRRAGVTDELVKKSERAFKFFKEEMSLIEPEIGGTNTRDAWVEGIIFERH